ncbi:MULTISPECIES: hypothetical protein [Flavobacterium]|uniref:Smr domain-containing protein n=1 Tax=Flavobacterium columnare TaxID=996 RepID=A0AA94JN62_9FLAO|nr:MULTISPECIES: hypothetical protein [Flavobacterium]AMA48592.1 hypothetical protein AWN65_03510 [Flavobacterium covae]AND65281.1 hypothetical protein AX766_13250 [Flavobacterium covae]MCH4828622.1 hypothetical protein [Flavobacterium columnare]MCH4831875.1 hypothetical protein [Flavobacterium columnare]MCJ1810194.1 hypothetical protein [Flavobacterium covae]
MEVKFDLVRIGKIRKNSISETILKQNIDLLRNEIRRFLIDETINNKNNILNLVMIIPGKGHNVKIALHEINDLNIKKQLKNNFPNSIYKGEYSIILNNTENKVFKNY